VRVNGVNQSPVAVNENLVYNIHVGDTIGLKIDTSLSLQASNSSVGSPSNTTFTVRHDADTAIELSSTPGATQGNPVLAGTVLPNGTRQYPSLKARDTNNNSALRTWVGTPNTSSTWYYAVDGNGPAMKFLLLPQGDADGYQVARLVNGTWQSAGPVSDGFLTLPDGTYAIRISDIEFTGTNFPIGITAAAPSDALRFEASTSPIPEPATAGLLGVASVGLLLRRRRRPG
jgi:hypothetical protein